MLLQCTLEGVRSAQGGNQAVISVTGNMATRPDHRAGDDPNAGVQDDR